MNLHYFWIYLAVFIGACAGNYISYLFITNEHRRREERFAKLVETLKKLKDTCDIEEEKDDK